MKKGKGEEVVSVPAITIRLEGKTLEHFDLVKDKMQSIASWHVPTNGDVLRFALYLAAKSFEANEDVEIAPNEQSLYPKGDRPKFTVEQIFDSTT